MQVIRKVTKSFRYALKVKALAHLTERHSPCQTGAAPADWRILVLWKQGGNHCKLPQSSKRRILTEMGKREFKKDKAPSNVGQTTLEEVRDEAKSCKACDLRKIAQAL